MFLNQFLRFIIHGSSNPDNARRETNWFQNLLLNDSSSSSLPESKKKVTSSSVAKSGTQQSRKTGLVRSTPSPTTMTTAKTTKTSRASTTTIPATRSKIPSVKSNTAAKSNMVTMRYTSSDPVY